MLKMVAGMGDNERIGIRGGMGDLTGGSIPATLTSLSPLTLPNSASKSLKLSLAGESKQGSTTGAQLLPPLNIPDGEVNGVKYWMEDGCVVLDGTSTAGTGSVNDLYFIGANGKYEDAGFLVGDIHVHIYDIPNDVTFYVVRGSDKVVIATLNVVAKTGTFTHVEGETYRIMLRIGWSKATFNKSKVRVMINAGTTAKTWEPYTGGKPSPSPEYPQEIRSAGVRTKNLFNGVFYEGFLHLNTGEIKTNPDYPNSIYGDPIRLSAGKTYTCSGFEKPAGAVLRYRVYDLNGAYMETSPNGTLPRYTPDVDCYVRLLFYDGLTEPEKSKIQMEEGSTDTAYEPYGYKTDVRISGKNLLDPRVEGTAKELLSGVTVKGITIKPLKDGRVQVSGTPTATTGTAYTLMYGNIISMLEDGETYAFRESVQFKKFDDNVGYGSVFTVDKSTMEEIRPYLQRNISVYRDGEILYPMLIRGNSRPTPADWEPYHPPQTATIYTKEPLRGINGYRDAISKKDGVWGVERKNIEYAFDGTESWTIADILKYKVATLSVNKSISQYNVSNIRCSHAKPLTWDNTGIVCFVDNYNIFRFGGMGVEQVQTLAAWKSWVADQDSKGTPLTIIYTLAKPVWEPLDDATQAALNALTSYKGTTIIEVDSGEVGMTMTAIYKAKKGR